MLQSWQDEVTPSISVGNLPADITKRELAHIFRPFLGFLVRPPDSVSRGGWTPFSLFWCLGVTGWCIQLWS